MDLSLIVCNIKEYVEQGRRVSNKYRRFILKSEKSKNIIMQATLEIAVPPYDPRSLVTFPLIPDILLRSCLTILLSLLVGYLFFSSQRLTSLNRDIFYVYNDKMR